jgi:hypothetical protein
MPIFEIFIIVLIMFFSPISSCLPSIFFSHRPAFGLHGQARASIFLPNKMRIVIDITLSPTTMPASA